MPVSASDRATLFGSLRGIERGLAELNERRRTSEIGQVAKPIDRAGRVAAHATDAIERLRRILHVLVRQTGSGNPR